VNGCAMSDTDKYVLERWITRREARAFREIFVRHSGMVYATCRRILGSAAEAEDVAQDCFEALAQVKRAPGPYLGPWLHRVATNLSLKRIRSETRRREREGRFAAGREAHAEPEWGDVYAYVDEAMAALPEKLRVPMVAHFLETESLASIARTLNVSPRTVAYRIDRGIALIRKSLRKRGVAVTASCLAAMMAANIAEAAAAPASLMAALGKLAVSGASSAESALAANATVIGSLAAMKLKTVVVCAIAVAICAGLYLGLRSRGRFQSDSPAGKVRWIVSKESSLSRTTQEPHSNAGGPNLDEAQREERAAAVSGEGNAPGITTAQKDDREVRSERTEKPKRLRKGEIAGPQEYGSVSGTVVNQQGLPIPGARLTALAAGVDWSNEPLLYGFALQEGERAFEAVTDGDGRYEIADIRFEGTAHITVSAVDYGPASEDVEIRPGSRLTGVDFILPPGATLIGRLLTAQDAPVTDARIQAAMVGYADEPGRSLSRVKPQTPTAYTDTDGVFVLSFYENATLAMLLASSPRYGTATFPEISLSSGEFLELRMGETVALTGRITWRDGSPAAGFYVQLAPVSPGMPVNYNVAPELIGVSEVDGRYEIAGVVSGNRYQARVADARGSVMTAQRSLLPEPGTPLVWDVALGAPITVRGLVSGVVSGQPLRYVAVAHMKDFRVAGYCVTEADGSYALRLAEPGNYVICPGYLLGEPEDWSDPDEWVAQYGKEVRVGGGEEKVVDLVMPDPVTLSVRAVDRAGNALAGVPASVHSEGSGGLRHATDEDGRFSWSGFPPGLNSWIELRSHAGYLATDSTPVVGAPGEVFPEETLVMFRASGLEATVLLPDGRPAAYTLVGIAVCCAEGPVFSLETRTDGHGTFALADQVPATRASVEIRVLGGDGGSLTWTSEAIEFMPEEVTMFGEVRLSAPR